MKNRSRFLFGVIVVVLGIILLFEQAGIMPYFSKYIWIGFAKFWPLVLIFLGAKLLINRNDIPGILLLLLGVAFLSSTLFSWNFFSILWPIAIISIGFSVLFRNEKKVKSKAKSSTSEKEYISESVLFWGSERKIMSKDFKGGEFNVVFGGLELDLREAQIAKEGAKIHINCAFGGVEVFVPRECRVITNGTGVLGSWNPMVKDRGISEPVLEITGGAIFGGVDIKE